MSILLSVLAAAVVALALLLPCEVRAFQPGNALGDWEYPENGSVIRFYACGEYICAKIVKVKDPSRRDINNPDPKLRNRPIAGIVISTNGKQTGMKSWIGDLYNPQDGATYRGTVHLIGDKQATMVGCFAGGLLCEAKTLRRAASPLVLPAKTKAAKYVKQRKLTKSRKPPVKTPFFPASLLSLAQ